MELNRRDFLKGALATSALAASGAALAGCAPAQGAGSASSSEAKDQGELLTADNYQERKWSFEIPPEPVADDDIAETITHDIVIVGAGMAGLCTAVSAAEKGADVVVFSASTKPISRGGSNHAIGSKIQKEFGIDYTPETAAHVVKMEQTAGSYFMDKKKWERWINHSAESIDWTIDHMEARGLHCCLEPGYTDPTGVLTVPPASHNFWNEDQPFGALFGAPLEAQAYADIFTEDFGGEIHYQTVGQYLIRDDNNTGRVSAVVAQREDGTYVKYVANKAVVLATGDFSKNPDMMAKYSPWAWENFRDTLTVGDVDYDVELGYSGLMPGDGHKMGLWVGAAWQKTFPVPPMINGGCAGPSHDVISNFWGLNMDIHGERYQNENTNFSYGAISVLQLPEKTAFGVWDTAYAYTRDSWEQFGCSVGYTNGIMPLSPEELIAKWDKSVEEGSNSIGNGSTYYKADTIEELVEQMEGIDKEQALKTIERYNQYAENHLDEEYFVDPSILYPISTPPFYATKTVGATFLTVCGGLRTNEKMQVCAADDTPIEGLYCTGIMTGDFYANTYNFVMPGQNLGAVCGTLSYLLGRDLAQL
ncbi:FAD-dependent oxidoreductase [Enterorhabdus mucosicola]|uniref:FAD-dependent oxidoreductase n=1 Tax=Adlercreutzia mucosicola TaxID=580026 RepID=A0A6N8JKN6_9ACTN|nr:FAD-dependent oxidoreductase [Adlercreutzia mucosicola]MVX60212.1 FAD-dependent oxidoreductase [Adlercreutzia mucosicola]